MEFSSFLNELNTLCPEMKVSVSESMAAHTSFRIGGPAAVMVFPQDPQQLAEVLKLTNEKHIPVRILGAGTNVLAPDEGMQEVVICLKDSMDGVELLDGNRIRVAAGVTMARAAVFAANKGLAGMEFAHGIPGTVGGGVYMNAGAYGGEIGNICESVDVVTLSGELKTLSQKDMCFSYRHSILEENFAVVVSVVLQLQEGKTEDIRGKMQELMEKRKASQPLDKPSAGSAFKRPVGGYAAALIDQAGLKGFQIGGAAVSEKHAGFVVNMGGATAADVKQLLRQVADRVQEHSGITIEPEVRIW